MPVRHNHSDSVVAVIAFLVTAALGASVLALAGQPPQPAASAGGLGGSGIIEALEDGPALDRASKPLAEVPAIAPQLYPFFPQGGALWQDLVVNNHVDLGTGGVPFDFDCTDRTYVGHRGHDADIVGFREQQIGVPIFAALDGLVTSVHDGEPDTNTEALGQPANYVILDHGNGQTSWYWHMKRGSIAVSAGQTVRAGTVLGLTGSSGSSTWPHLHFESQLNGVVYEPSSGPCRPGPSDWVSQIPVRHETFVKNFTFANVPFSGGAGYPWDQVTHTGTFLLGTVATYFRVSIANFPLNGVYRATYTRPNGTIALDFNGVFSGGFRDGWLWFWANLGGGLDTTGTWTVRLFVNDSLVATAPFDVVTNAAENVNHPPLGVSVWLDPPSPSTADVPFCRIAPSVLYRRDPDYDVVRYRYRWRVNGTVVRDARTAALSDAIPRATVSSQDSLTCEVTPIDDYEVAGPSSSTSAEPLSLTLSSNLAFPTAAGTAVTWTATPTGGASPYTYRFLVFDGVTWTIGRDWSPSNTWRWEPALPGSYVVQVWGRNSLSTSIYDAWRGASATVSMPNAFTVTSVVPDPISAPAGSPVTWTATALGGTAPYLYTFFVFDGAKWTLGQNWSTSNTWTWTPPAAGTYRFQVWARNAGSLSIYDAWKEFGPYTAKVPGDLEVTALTAGVPAPQPAGTPVMWKATTMTGVAPVTYKFLVYDGSTWTIGQDWGEADTWTWIPSAAGNYSVQVWARNAGSTSMYDAWRGAGPYSVTSDAPLRVTSLMSDRTEAAPAFTPVQWTAHAAGGIGPYSFKFFVHSGTTWAVGQDWSPADTWTWIPTAAGTYSVQVWVRNAGSGAVYDAWAGTTGILVTNPAPLFVSNLTISPMSPLGVSGPAIITATASGGAGPYTFKFYVFDDMTWKVGQDWSASNTWIWFPPAPGTYGVQVWVRNERSTSVYDAWAALGPLTVQWLW